MKRNRPNLNTVRGFILGLVVLAFAQTGARADCGDHVVLGGKAAQAQQALEHGAFPGHPTNRPCSGPTCRKQSPMAPAVPVDVSKRLVDQPLWVALLEMGEPASVGAFSRVSDRFCLSGGHPEGVFHPPRV